MTKDDIIKLAAASYDQGVADAKQEALAALEQIVAAARADEREACAELCDDLDDDIVDGLAGWQYGEAIRARGNK
ncbi:hypothetical protein UFOVP662_20 [uncultured Caudovirales phage]|jgi:hypothetical protein|uniref:Uncharacterized protein n=1 Tax=uncultured Caudovirales phage TaxID=2100421 RepID=A0A6J5QFM8_9CAUD|nr:hypothetical protein UFOVP662_20 [uncultured Caudovirales phage]CAB4181177.1 hypothetical protein UFOVP1067_20 [uncultured Caudovirales phage]